MKRPATQFYWSDHFRDPGIRASSFEARGLWTDLLCMMHEGEPYGHLTLGGVAPSDEDLAQMVGGSVENMTKLLAELGRKRVYSRTAEGIIFCRRMVRDELKRQAHAEAGKMGGNPKLVDDKPRVKTKVKPRDKLTDENPGNQKVTPSSSSSTSETTTHVPAERIYAFMGEMRPVWVTAYGGEIPPGTAKRLKPLVDRHGAPEVATRLAHYLAATDAQFASIPRFVSTFGSWDKPGASKKNGQHPGETPQEYQFRKRGYV